MHRYVIAHAKFETVLENRTASGRLPEIDGKIHIGTKLCGITTCLSQTGTVIMWRTY